jgi:hypothetical protein
MQNIGRPAAVLKYVLPVIHNSDPESVKELRYNNQLPVNISGDTWTTTTRYLSSHQCDCGACEDCQGHFQELLHRRYWQEITKEEYELYNKLEL